MANFYLMCGVPGAGKSTWIKNHVKPGTAVVSRDAIRFSLLEPGDRYFSKEHIVLDLLWDQINGALSDGRDVICDQTSLTRKSRKFILSHITGYDTCSVIWIDSGLEDALAHNELRKGTIAYVPPERIKEMYSDFVAPSYKEGFDYIYKWDYNENVMKMKRKEED